MSTSASPATPALDLPPGFTARAVELRGDDGGPDVDLAFDVSRRCEQAAIGEVELGRGETLAMLAGPEADVEHGRLVLGPDGRAAGLLMLELDPEAGSLFIDVYTDPDYPALPDGLAAGLLGIGLARARALASEHARAWTAKAGSYAGDTGYREALEAAGFEPVRHFWRMVIATDDPAVPAEAPPAPDGATIEVARTPEQLRELHAVFEASFVDHWDHHAADADAWIEKVRALDGHDPDRWWLVRIDGEAAALCILDDSRAEAGDGYVRTLGVGRGFRGRGLARWLLQRAFAEYRSLGRRAVVLTVDHDSPTGAKDLYESVGMRPTLGLVAYHLDVPVPG